MALDARIRRRLKLRDLDTLLTVARHGSMAKSAGPLFVSQPAVSKAIAELEATLGVRLLDRTARGVEPNVYGRALLKCAVAVFDELEQGVKAVDALADPTTGEVCVGATAPMMAGALPAILERLHRKHPRIRVEAKHISHIPDAARELRDRSIDIGLGRLVEAKEDIDALALFDDRTFVIAATDNPWTSRRRVRAELSGEPWVLPPPGTLIRKLIEQAFDAEGLRVPQAHVLTQATHLQIAMISRGPYLAIAPGSMLDLGVAAGIKRLAVKLAIPAWPTGVVTLKGRTISAAGQRFIDAAREVTAPLAKAN